MLGFKWLISLATLMLNQLTLTSSTIDGDVKRIAGPLDKLGGLAMVEAACILAVDRDYQIVGL